VILAAILVWGSSAPAEDGAPMYGSWGFDLSAMDRAAPPGDSFFRYANGTWLDQTTIPADRNSASLRLLSNDRVEVRLREMLESSAEHAAGRPNDLAGKVGAFYKAFMDEERIESLGAKPIEPQLAAVRGAKSYAALAALMGRSNTDFDSSVFAASIDVDAKDPAHYALYLQQAGLGLPDRDYYLQPAFAPQKAAYGAYAAQLLTLVGWPEPAKAAREVLAFETRLAESSATREQQRDPGAAYNPLSLRALQQLTPGFAWQRFLLAARLPEIERVIVVEKGAFPVLADTFAQTPIETLQAWQAFHVTDNAAPYLSKPFAEAWYELHERALSGQQQQRARWKRGITAVSGDDFAVGNHFGSFGTMGWGVGQLYVARYFPPPAKARIEALIGDVRRALRERLQTLEWMSSATRAEAIRKLDGYQIKVGYPDHRRDYGRLTILDDDLVGDVLRAAAADWALVVGRYHGPVDRSDWALTPQTNDAYNGSLQDIVFPAGFLQPPMFDPEADAAINYGSIGAFIGHELIHGFDDQGRKRDATGALRDWWAGEDAATFQALAARLGRQYAAYRPIADDSALHVNGELTMGENIADLGGVTVALDAYRSSLHGQAAPQRDGFSGEQRVFLGWAQVMRGKRSDDMWRKLTVSDPHSPYEFRVNGVVRNIDDWYTAFGIKPGSALYLAPEDRVHLW
jgi:putative endopeptidase